MLDNQEKIINKIMFELEKIKYKLEKDGGNIKFINFKNGILKIQLLGECVNCSMANITLKYAIEEPLMKKIPEIKKIININIKLI